MRPGRLSRYLRSLVMSIVVFLSLMTASSCIVEREDVWSYLRSEQYASLAVNLAKLSAKSLPGIDTLATLRDDSAVCRFRFAGSRLKVSKGAQFLSVGLDTVTLISLLKDYRGGTMNFDTAGISFTDMPKKSYRRSGTTSFEVDAALWHATTDSATAVMDFEATLSVLQRSEIDWRDYGPGFCRGYYHLYKDTTVVDSVIKLPLKYHL
jgi:hypothetical protein